MHGHADEVVTPAGRLGMASRLRVAHRAGALLLTAAVTLAQASFWGAETAGLGEASTLVIALLFAGAAAVVAQRVAQEPAERRFWALLTMIGAVLLAGRVYLAFRPFSLDPAPSPATWLDLSGALVFLVALTVTTRLWESAPGPRLRYMLDMATALITAFVAMSALILPPAFRGVALSPAELATASAYGAVGTLMVLGSLTSMVAPGQERDAWERFLAAGLVVFGLATALWGWWYADLFSPGRWAGTPLLETLWVAAVALIGCAALFRITGGDARWRPLPFGVGGVRGLRRDEVVASFAPVATVVLFLVAAVGTDSVEMRRLLGNGVLILAGLAVLRTGVVSFETAKHRRWSDVDELTGLYEPAAFHRRLDDEIELSRRHGHPLAVAILDVDDLSFVNQASGYERGDDLLARLARHLRSECDRHDVPGRIEADVFALLLPQRDAASAEEECEALRTALVTAPDVRRTGITVSTGIAAFPEHGSDAATLMRLADEARRSAKAQGKDRLVVYAPDLPAASDPAERVRVLLERSRLETVRQVAEAVDARHSATTGHSRRVADMAVGLAERLGLAPRRVRLVEMAALVHDVGKVGVPDALLGRSDALAAQDRLVVEEHPLLSARIVAAAGLPDVAEWVGAHHERWDGKGYPRGLTADAIPLEARILAVCDALDEAQVARDGTEESRTAVDAVLLEGMGLRFDPKLSRVLMAAPADWSREAS